MSKRKLEKELNDEVKYGVISILVFGVLIMAFALVSVVFADIADFLFHLLSA